MRHENPNTNWQTMEGPRTEEASRPGIINAPRMMDISCISEDSSALYDVRTTFRSPPTLDDALSLRRVVTMEDEEERTAPLPAKSPIPIKTQLTLYSDLPERGCGNRSFISSASSAAASYRSPIPFQPLQTPRDKSARSVRKQRTLDFRRFSSHNKSSVESDLESSRGGNSATRSRSHKKAAHQFYHLSPLLNQAINIGEGVATAQKSLGTNIMQNIASDLLEQNQQLSRTVEELTSQLEQREKDNAAANEPSCKEGGPTPNKQSSAVASVKSLPSSSSFCQHSNVAPIIPTSTSETGDTFHSTNQEVVALQAYVLTLKQKIQRLEAQNTRQTRKIDSLKQEIVILADLSVDVLNAVGVNLEESSCITSSGVSGLSVSTISKEKPSIVVTGMAAFRFQQYVSTLQKRVGASNHQTDQGVSVKTLLDAPLDPDNLTDILDWAAELYADCSREEPCSEGGLVLQWEPPPSGDRLV